MNEIRAQIFSSADKPLENQAMTAAASEADGSKSDVKYDEHDEKDTVLRSDACAPRSRPVEPSTVSSIALEEALSGPTALDRKRTLPTPVERAGSNDQPLFSGMTPRSEQGRGVLMEEAPPMLVQSPAQLMLQPTPAQPTPAQSTPAQSTPAQPTPAQLKLAQPTPAQPTPDQPAPALPIPAQPIPAQPIPAQPIPAQPTPAPSTPAQPTPAQPTPAQPTPAPSSHEAQGSSVKAAQSSPQPEYALVMEPSLVLPTPKAISKAIEQSSASAQSSAAMLMAPPIPPCSVLRASSAPPNSVRDKQPALPTPSGTGPRSMSGEQAADIHRVISREDSTAKSRAEAVATIQRASSGAWSSPPVMTELHPEMHQSFDRSADAELARRAFKEATPPLPPNIATIDTRATYENETPLQQQRLPMPRPPLEPPPPSLPPSAPQSEPPSMLPSVPPSASASAPPSKMPSKPPSPPELQPPSPSPLQLRPTPTQRIDRSLQGRRQVPSTPFSHLPDQCAASTEVNSPSGEMPVAAIDDQTQTPLSSAMDRVLPSSGTVVGQGGYASSSTSSICDGSSEHGPERTTALVDDISISTPAAQVHDTHDPTTVRIDSHAYRGATMSGEEHLAGSACMSCMDATWRNEAILVPSLFGSPSRAERNHEERESDTVHELQTRQVVSKALSESGDAFDGTLITSVQPCADLESLSAASDGISSSPKVVSTVPAIQDRRYTAIHEPQPRPTPRPWLPTPAPVAEVALKSTSTPIQPLALTNVEQPSEMPPDSESQPSQAQSAATPSSHAKPPSSRVQFAAPPSRGSPCGFSCAPKRAASRTPLSAAAAPRPTRPSLASIARAPSCMTRTSATHGSAGRNSILPGAVQDGLAAARAPQPTPRTSMASRHSHSANVTTPSPRQSQATEPVADSKAATDVPASVPAPTAIPSAPAAEAPAVAPASDAITAAARLEAAAERLEAAVAATSAPPLPVSSSQRVDIKPISSQSQDSAPLLLGSPPSHEASDATWRAWAERVAMERNMSGLTVSDEVSAAEGTSNHATARGGSAGMAAAVKGKAKRQVKRRSTKLTAPSCKKRGASAAKKSCSTSTDSSTLPLCSPLGMTTGGGVFVSAALGSGGAAGGGFLALGASVVELSPGHEAFELCVELLNRQAFCSDGSGVALSVLRVMQIQDHYVDLPSLMKQQDAQVSPPVATKGRKASGKISITADKESKATISVCGVADGDSSARLVFVSGELDALAKFVRQSLRLMPASSVTTSSKVTSTAQQILSPALVVSERLDASQGWGGASRRAASDKQLPLSEGPPPSLRVWRVVLAVVWPKDESKGSSSKASQMMMPAFIIDYAAERLECQLGV